MKYNKGFAPILVLAIVLGVLVVGGGAYYIGKSSAPAMQNIQDNNYQPQVDQNPQVNTNTNTNPVLISPTTKPSITVLSPNGGETWTKGQKVKISWTSSKDIKFVDIWLSEYHPKDSDGQFFVGKIASNVPNIGSYNWIVQGVYAEVLGVTGFPESNKNLIMIENSENSNPNDVSDAPFSIVASTATSDTLNWKTYTNNQYGYELKYPGNWQFAGESGNPPAPSFFYKWNNKSYCQFRVDPTDSSGEIPSRKSKGYVETKITVAGVSAIKLSKSPVDTQNNQSEDVVYLGQGLNYYRITRISYKDENEGKCIDTFNQILSTFKFTK